MVTAAIQLAYLLIEVSRLGGINSVVEEAVTLRPDSFKEAPEPTNKSDLEGRCGKILRLRALERVERLHGLAPSRRDPSLKDIEPADLALVCDSGFQVAASRIIG